MHCRFVTDGDWSCRCHRCYIDPSRVGRPVDYRSEKPAPQRKADRSYVGAIDARVLFPMAFCGDCVARQERDAAEGVAALDPMPIASAVVRAGVTAFVVATRVGMRVESLERAGRLRFERLVNHVRNMSVGLVRSESEGS